MYSLLDKELHLRFELDTDTSDFGTRILALTVCAYFELEASDRTVSCWPLSRELRPQTNGPRIQAAKIPEDEA